MSIWFVVLIIFSVTAKIIVTICEDNSKGVLANQKQYQKKPHVKRPENEYRKFERITGPDLPMTDLPAFIPALWNSRVISEVKMENPVEKEIAACIASGYKINLSCGKDFNVVEFREKMLEVTGINPPVNFITVGAVIPADYYNESEPSEDDEVVKNIKMLKDLMKIGKGESNPVVFIDGKYSIDFHMIKTYLARAITVQKKRGFKNRELASNCSFLRPEEKGLNTLDMLSEIWNVGGAVLRNIIVTARTIADISGSKVVKEEHIFKASRNYLLGDMWKVDMSGYDSLSSKLAA